MTVTVPATAFLLYKLTYTSVSRRNCEPARNLTLINILIKTYVRLRAVCLQVFHSLPLPVLPSRVLQCVSSLISDLSFNQTRQKYKSTLRLRTVFELWR